MIYINIFYLNILIFHSYDFRDKNFLVQCHVQIIIFFLRCPCKQYRSINDQASLDAILHIHSKSFRYGFVKQFLPLIIFDYS
ncbi:hypothetical protein BFR87_06410 [Acinetobacter pittii]|nr:hypothetical protein BFR87_06410 [Acinetobacter pittii]